MDAKSRKQMKLLTTGIGYDVEDNLEKNKALIVTRVCGVGYFVALTTLAILCIIAGAKYKKLSAEYATLHAENRGLKSQITFIEDEKVALSDAYDELESSYEVMYTSYASLAEIANELDTENQEVLAAYEKQSAELQKFQEREELYDKYEYALFRDDGSRTDINYDDLKSLEELAKEKNISDDAIKLILNIPSKESNYCADVKNPKSSAIGLCGLIKSTARTIYNNELGAPLGKYDHYTMGYDSGLNLQIGLALINYLAEYEDGDVIEVMKDYMGEDNKAYLNALDKVLKKNCNKSLYDLQL